MMFPGRLRGNHAFSVIEMLVVLAVIAILAGLLLPALANAKGRAQEIACRNNLKQVGLGFRIFSVDHDDHFPMQVSTNGGGSKEFCPDGAAAYHFRPMSNELVTPKVLVCPADSKSAATTFAALENSSLSYFVGLDADETQPAVWLSGDGNLTGGQTGPRGVITLRPESAVAWAQARHASGGNIGLADGSVQGISDARLRDSLKQSGITNRLALP